MARHTRKYGYEASTKESLAPIQGRECFFFRTFVCVRKREPLSPFTNNPNYYLIPPHAQNSDPPPIHPPPSAGCVRRVIRKELQVDGGIRVG